MRMIDGIVVVIVHRDFSALCQKFNQNDGSDLCMKVEEMIWNNLL